jgi:hypothetical protein
MMDMYIDENLEDEKAWEVMYGLSKSSQVQFSQEYKEFFEEYIAGHAEEIQNLTKKIMEKNLNLTHGDITEELMIKLYGKVSWKDLIKKIPKGDFHPHFQMDKVAQ